MSKQALIEGAASRVPASVGLDPLSILSFVVPALFSCLQDNDNVKESQIRSRVQTLHERDPERLRQRTAKNIRRKANKKKKKDEQISEQQSLELADALLAELLDASDDTVESAAVELSQE